MNIIKSIIKAFNGYDLDPREQRQLDAFLFEIKCVIITILVVFILVWLLWVFGTFEGKEEWRYHDI